jgi:hypothetical protein
MKKHGMRDEEKMNGGGGLKRQCLFHDGDECMRSPTSFSSLFDENIDISVQKKMNISHSPLEESLD